MSETRFCPATMCPLFAPDGSPWTGEKDGVCPNHDDIENDGCMFWSKDHCDGCRTAVSQVYEVQRKGGTLQIGPVQRTKTSVTPKEFDCPRSHECQWQAESRPSLCPPRLALSIGVDPKSCAW
ncbi:MAG: hypothetical protein P4L67_04435 [Candidatus Pacebacteria bacterium]|nr:hypothetical protein [Candidatus Paceibacterota bacterium]